MTKKRQNGSVKIMQHSEIIQRILDRMVNSEVWEEEAMVLTEHMKQQEALIALLCVAYAKAVML